MSKLDELYTVWVGGVEVNDYYLSHTDAVLLHNRYVAEGFDDVILERIG